MTDPTELAEIAAIAAALYFLTPPARTQIAPGLHALGMRMHPELATKQLVREGPAWLGNHAPQRLESLGAMDALRIVNPTLVEQIEQARATAATGDPSASQELGAKIVADFAAFARQAAEYTPPAADDDPRADEPNTDPHGPGDAAP